MWLAAEMGLIALPDVTERQFQDKSKRNSLVTTLALVHIAQLVAALGSRYPRGLSVSQPEAVALAYAVCAVLTYALQWSCPKDVGVPDHHAGPAAGLEGGHPGRRQGGPGEVVVGRHVHHLHESLHVHAPRLGEP